MKKIVLLLSFCCLFMSYVRFIDASEINLNNEYFLVSQTEKYYKTITVNKQVEFQNNLYSVNDETSKTYEITKEEYDNANISISTNSASIETTYKRLTSSIYQSGNLFKYEAVLNWKNFPKKRSYDIIGIGFYNNVKPLSSPSYYTDYCTTNGVCRRITSHSSQTLTTGVGTTFELPAGDLSSLSTNFSVIVTKNTSNTITEQISAADYSHATSNISLSNSKNFSINASGIALNGIASYYDSIQTATAWWNGSW